MDGTVVATGSIARGTIQVLVCSLLAVIWSLILHAIYYGRERPINYFFDKDDKDDYHVEL
jgi:hypothetical protein